MGEPASSGKARYLLVGRVYWRRGSCETFCSLRGETCRLPWRHGNRRGRKDEAVMGRQESDDREVPEGRRKTSRAEESQQGKAVTVSKQAEQLGLFTETAENPKGAEAGVAASPLAAKRAEVPALRADIPRWEPRFSARPELSHGHQTGEDASGRRLRLGGRYRPREVFRRGSITTA